MVKFFPIIISCLRYTNNAKGQANDYFMSKTGINVSAYVEDGQPNSFANWPYNRRSFIKVLERFLQKTGLRLLNTNSP